MLRRRLSPVPVAALVLAVQAVATVVAIAFDWRTCFDKAAAHQPVSSAFVGHGSAISAPVLALVVLAVCAGLLTRGRRARIAGRAGFFLVALAFAWGAVGEALSDPSAHTSRLVLLASLVLNLAQSALLATAAWPSAAAAPVAVVGVDPLLGHDR